MIQPPRPGDLVDIDVEECLELLRTAPWVRVAFIIDDAPEVLPINVLVHEGALHFRTASGSKLGSAAAAGAVAVQADGGDADTRMAWSVVAHGHAEIVTDPDVEEALLARPFEPWALPDDRDFWIRVQVSSLTGRRIVRG